MTDIDTTIQELFDAGAHLGHKTERVHPKAKRYIYKVENGVSIIDLTQTAADLEKAIRFVSGQAAEGKTLLVVATKKIAASAIQELCQKNNIFYVTVKWPAGLLTNFDMIMKNVKKLVTMKEERDKGEWQKFVKHEQVELGRQLSRLEKFYGGLIGLAKLPDLLFVVDIKKEKNAVKEAGEKNIPVVAIIDTNANPDIINYPIPANDDSSTSIEYIAGKVINAYAKGRKKQA